MFSLLREPVQTLSHNFLHDSQDPPLIPTRKAPEVRDYEVLLTVAITPHPQEAASQGGTQRRLRATHFTKSWTQAMLWAKLSAPPS